MAEKIIVCDMDKCNGCRLCEYACAIHHGKTLNPRLSRIISVRQEPVLHAAISCVLCEKKDCLNGCPTQAIIYDKDKKLIAVDNDKCDACGLCIERCSYGCITMSLKEKKVFVCDFCTGDKPKCVEFCPKQALSFDKPSAGTFQAGIL